MNIELGKYPSASRTRFGWHSAVMNLDGNINVNVTILWFGPYMVKITY